MLNEIQRNLVVISTQPDGCYVYIPDFGISTQGSDVADAMYMTDAMYIARDAIGLMGIDMEDDNETIPVPNSVTFETRKDDILTLVDVNFVEYRRKVDNKAVKKIVQFLTGLVKGQNGKG